MRRALRLRLRQFLFFVDDSVQPHGLALQAGNWYLVAQPEAVPHLPDLRILDVGVLPESFDHVEGFDLASHWNSRRRLLQRGGSENIVFLPGGHFDAYTGQASGLASISLHLGHLST